MNATLARISNEWRIVIILCGLACILAAASFEGGRLSHAPVIRDTKTVRVTVAEQYGKPTQTVAGAKINKALAGLTCDIYSRLATIICHR